MYKHFLNYLVKLKINILKFQNYDFETMFWLKINEIRADTGAKEKRTGGIKTNTKQQTIIPDNKGKLSQLF